LERYKAVVIPRPTNSKKFIIFPTPRYRNNKKSVAVKAITKPLSEVYQKCRKGKKKGDKENQEKQRNSAEGGGINKIYDCYGDEPRNDNNN